MKLDELVNIILSLTTPGSGSRTGAKFSIENSTGCNDSGELPTHYTSIELLDLAE